MPTDWPLHISSFSAQGRHLAAKSTEFIQFNWRKCPAMATNMQFQCHPEFVFVVDHQQLATATFTGTRGLYRQKSRITFEEDIIIISFIFSNVVGTNQCWALGVGTTLISSRRLPTLEKIPYCTYTPKVEFFGNLVTAKWPTYVVWIFWVPGDNDLYWPKRSVQRWYEQNTNRVHGDQP